MSLVLPDLMTSEDVWEREENLVPRQSIVSLLTVRKEASGFVCHLRVEMGGPDCAEQFTAVASVAQVGDWLRRFHMAAAVAERLGTDESPYALVRRWAEVFAEPLRQFSLTAMHEDCETIRFRPPV